jgi:hypothetical protein
MTTQITDWTYLIPGISILHGRHDLTAYLGFALFIVMILIFAWCCIKLWNQYQVFNTVRLAIANLVEGAEKSSLALERQAVLDKASQSTVPGVKELWREFDESLVSSADMKKLYNTLDADHFFNARTLAGGLTSNRLLAATPSFLTAIGVLGTFLGLTLGLSGLDFSSNELTVLKDGINQMISGAGVAFTSSVWGVFLSLLLNWIEKRTERNVLQTISKLQRTIDYLYPRLPAEKVLVDISDHSRESQKSLSGLAEQIGDKLQESVEGMSRSMQEAISKTLTEILNPALQSMSSNASQQSTQVLEALIEQFSSGLRAEGQRQKESMDGASEAVNRAMAGISDKMDTLFTQLSERQRNQTEADEVRSSQFTEQINRQKELAEKQQVQQAAQFEQQVRALSSHQESAVASLVEATDKQVATFTGAANAQAEQMSKAFASVVDRMENQTEQQINQLHKQATETEARFSSVLGSVSGEQQKLITSIADGINTALDQARQLAQQHQQLMEKLNVASSSMESSSSNMNSSASQLGILSTNLRSASDQLGENTKAVAESLTETAVRNSEAYAGVKEQIQTLEKLENGIISVADKFEDTAKLAQSSFTDMRQHQTEYLQNLRIEITSLSDSLKNQVLTIEEQASEWLSQYSNQVTSQVDGRMTQWNDQTREFSDRMILAVNTISGILDELSAREQS